MRRLGRVLVVLAVAALAAGTWLLWPPTLLPARFAQSDCRLLDLEDSEGRPIVGIEDIARQEDALLLSAHDRLTAEAGDDPAGGLYRFPLSSLADPGPVRLTRLEGSPSAPHGIATFGVWVGVVERLYGPSGHEGTDIGFYQLKEGRLEEADRHSGPWFCAANDMAWLEGRAYATFDRTSCPGLSMYDALGLMPGGRLALLRHRSAALPVSTDLRHPNGLVALGEDRIAVSETRGRRLRIYGGLADLDPDTRLPTQWSTWSETARATPGAPDNLSLAPDGRLVAALHPSLLRLAAYRYGWRDRAPTRIAAIDPTAGAVEILYDDPGGELFSGATVGLLLDDGRLVAGSVRDAGLLVCGPVA